MDVFIALFHNPENRIDFSKPLSPKFDKMSKGLGRNRHASSEKFPYRI